MVRLNCPLVGLSVILLISGISAYTAFSSNLLPSDDVMPTLANGHLGFVTFGPSIHMNGLFNGFRGHSHRARIPNFSNIQIRNCVRELKTAADDCSYTLDQQNGYFKTVYQTEHYQVEHLLYPHRKFDRTIVNSFTVRRVGTERDPHTIALYHNDGGLSPDVSLYESQGQLSLMELNFTYHEATTWVREDPKYQHDYRPFYILHQEIPEEIVLGEEDYEVTISHLTVIDYYKDLVISEAYNVIMSDYRVLALHTAEWEMAWEKYGIFVEGDESLADAISTSLFFLLSSLPNLEITNRINPFYGLAPSGLGRGGFELMEYQGHSFWDTEMWMQPPLLMIEPRYSKELLHFRYLIREAVEDYANETGYKGIRYAWETGYTGRETTPPCCPEVVDFQHHITADVAFAARSYFFATLDWSWMRAEGCYLATKTAEFWESHVVYNEATKLYEILDVMGPDEDHSPISNNAYTNVLAAYNLYFGEFASCVCRSVLNDKDYEVMDKWSKIAKSLTLLYDETEKYNPQYEGYESSIVIKQADTILLGYPLQYPMDRETMKNNLEIYERNTRSDGPAMTWAMHAIGHLDLEDYASAADMFKKGYAPYLRTPFMVWSEATEEFEGVGNFLTGAGGFLQSVINGYGGVRFHPEYLEIKRTVLPPGTTRLNIHSIQYLKATFQIIADAQRTMVNVLESSTDLKLTAKYNNITVSWMTSYVLVDKDVLTIQLETNPFGECKWLKNEIGVPNGGRSLYGKISFVVGLFAAFLYVL